jgi:hypothetical protein
MTRARAMLELPRYALAWLVNSPCAAVGKDGRACLKTCRGHDEGHVSETRVWSGDWGFWEGKVFAVAKWGVQ